MCANCCDSHTCASGAQGGGSGRWWLLPRAVLNSLILVEIPGSGRGSEQLFFSSFAFQWISRSLSMPLHPPLGCSSWDALENEVSLENEA